MKNFFRKLAIILCLTLLPASIWAGNDRKLATSLPYFKPKELLEPIKPGSREFTTCVVGTVHGPSNTHVEVLICFAKDGAEVIMAADDKCPEVTGRILTYIISYDISDPANEESLYRLYYAAYGLGDTVSTLEAIQAYFEAGVKVEWQGGGKGVISAAKLKNTLVVNIVVENTFTDMIIYCSRNTKKV